MSTYSHKISLIRLFIFYFLSSGLYIFYWFYKNWKNLLEHHTMIVRPGLLTFGLVVPILNVYLIYDLWNQYKRVAAMSKVHTFKYPGLLALLFATLIFLPSVVEYLFPTFPITYPIFYPIIDTIIYISGIGVLMYAQRKINHFWEVVEEEKQEIEPIKGIEMVIIILGSLFLLFRFI
jgi:hypothetical protein